jgi:hypothetical protein
MELRNTNIRAIKSARERFSLQNRASRVFIGYIFLGERFQDQNIV